MEGGTLGQSFVTWIGSTNQAHMFHIHRYMMKAGKTSLKIDFSGALRWAKDFLR